MNRSTTIPSGKDLQRKWFVLDATGKTLGRLSTQAASILAGKNSVLYTPYIDVGDHVIVVNCEKIVLTGMKADKKLYRRYTDRKSTRLNSSHLGISYAVFCLKKQYKDPSPCYHAFASRPCLRGRASATPE